MQSTETEVRRGQCTFAEAYAADFYEEKGGGAGGGKGGDMTAASFSILQMIVYSQRVPCALL